MWGFEPKPIQIYAFGDADPLAAFAEASHGQYIRRYLADLCAKTVLEEPNYFDRDYLAEFAAFYSLSAGDFSGICRRLHVFSIAIDRPAFEAFLTGDPTVVSAWQEAYLGFVVVRPIEWAPFGRTVLRWYPQGPGGPRREIEPARWYDVHIGGVRLRVLGLAWQQQDTGVGACATIALWSALNSSAFDAHHVVPTTVDVTRAAHRTASLGSRVFPSTGLTAYQMCEAVKELGLAPIVSGGDLKPSVFHLNQDVQGDDLGEIDDAETAGVSATPDKAFSRDRFLSISAALLRSGYPLLLSGHYIQLTRTNQDIVSNGLHAVCAVGFREASSGVNGPIPGWYDGAVRVLYINDDNFGPAVRMEVEEHAATGAVILRAKGPLSPPQTTQWPDPTTGTLFMPSTIMCAVHDDLRTGIDPLHRDGFQLAGLFAKFVKDNVGVDLNVQVTFGFYTAAKYAGAVLVRQFHNAPDVLAKLRASLIETVPPMCLHLAVLRVTEATPDGARPLFDLLYDTTTGENPRKAFCLVAFDGLCEAIWRKVDEDATDHPFGVILGC